jgi:hypothetical protein
VYSKTKRHANIKYDPKEKYVVSDNKWGQVLVTWPVGEEVEIGAN